MGPRDRRDHAIFAFPTNDGLYGVFIAWPAAESHRVRSDVEARFMAALDGVPDLAARVRAGRREERFRGATVLPNLLRKPHGPGWALVGDAGCHKDPYLALGIADAFRDAELLTAAVDEGLSGGRALDAALADYEQRRNDATMPEYQLNLGFARFQPMPGDLRRIRAVVHGDAGATRRFFLASLGLVPPESFFNPENLARLMASTAATQPLYSPVVKRSEQSAGSREQ